jgi:hypothetical protein
MKIRIGRAALVAKVEHAQPDPVDVAFEQEQAEHAANIERLQAKKARLECTAFTWQCKIERKNETSAEKQLDRIFYLPSGRVGGCPNGDPYVEFDVTEKTEALLNSMVVSLIENANPPWLDLRHDGKSRLFDISHFKLNVAGLFCYGRYTALGKHLRDSGRISAVSVTIHSMFMPGKPVFAFGGFDFSTPPVKSESADQAKIPLSLSVLGGVLLDGERSAFQSITNETKPLPSEIVAQRDPNLGSL